MTSNPYCINSPVVDFVGRSIIGTEEPVPTVNKAVLALYLVNIITTNSAIVKYKYLTIGDENIFKELLSANELLDQVLSLFISKDYTQIGKLFQSF